jgi:hypothetical protein
MSAVCSAARSVGEWAARLACDRDEDVKHEWFVKDAWVYDSDWPDCEFISTSMS